MELRSRRDIVQALEDSRWIISEAARSLGVVRQTIYNYLRLYGIRRRPQSPETYREVRQRVARMGGLAHRASRRRQAAA